MTFVMGCILAIASLLQANASETAPGHSLADQRNHSLAASWLVSGLATWYDTPGLTAAAGPDLRHGDWRGSRVEVTGGGRSVVVVLSDACWCPDRNGVPVLLDLSATAFRRLAPLSKGVIAVEVTAARSIPLPATDTAP